MSSDQPQLFGPAESLPKPKARTAPAVVEPEIPVRREARCKRCSRVVIWFRVLEDTADPKARGRWEMRDRDLGRHVCPEVDGK